MANKEDVLLSQKKKLFNMLLKEGKRYLVIMQELYNHSKKDSAVYTKMLFVMDRFSRYKIQLKEDMEEFKEMFEEIDEMIDEDEESEEEEDEELAIELEEFENEEEEDQFFEEQIRYFHDIIHRKNNLANMEMLILHMLDVDETLMNFQLWVYSKLKVLVKNYCEKVRAILKRNANFVKFFNNFEKKRSAKIVQDKYRQLEELLGQVIEKQTFLTETVMQWGISEAAAQSSTSREKESN